MARANSFRSWLKITVLLAGVTLPVVACGGGGGGGGPTDPSPPTPMVGSARFTLQGAGQDGAVSYSNGSNLVVCRRSAGFADLFIRFAAQPAAGGENGPHLDIDVCNLGDGGLFMPKDPQVPSCAGGKSFGLFWHGDAGATFVNVANAPSCTLRIVRDGTTLSGTFSCLDLVEFGGNRRIDVLDGVFECSET